MNNHESEQFDRGISALPISQLPRSALQALYHSVTGKTENLTKLHSKNVVVRTVDIVNLHDRITQQMEHYDLIASPTVTVVVKNSEHRSLQYSSFQKFMLFQENTQAVTSDVFIKYEFILQLPNTSVHQRCIVNLSLDSGLPIIIDNDDDFGEDFFGIMFLSDYPTLRVSIDFVDFLVAKNFLNVIDEWFKSLDAVPRSRVSRVLARHLQTISVGLGQLDKVGLSIFIATYIYIHHGNVGAAGSFAYAISLALFVWALMTTIMRFASRSFTRSIRKGILPTIVIFSAGDEKAYKKCLDETVSTSIAIARLLVGIVSGIGLNVLASYIYAYLSASG